MSQAKHDTSEEASEYQQRLLSHLAAHIHHDMGGNMPIETLHLRATDYLDLTASEVEAAIKDQEGDIYTIERNHGEAKQILDVHPVGDPPDELGQIDGFEMPSDGNSADFSELRAVGENLSETLHEEGYNSFIDLHNESPATLADIPTVTQTKAELIIKQAGQHLPPGTKIAFEAIDRYQDHVNEHGTQSSVIQSIVDVSEDVGDPLALDEKIPTEQSHYMGFPKLRDRDHPHLVNASEFPQRDGEPIPPKATTIEHTNINTLDATCQKLGRGNMGLRLVGPHGCGKNYVLRYIHWKTNRVLASIDADSTMVAQDVLGISAVNEDRVSVFRDGILTKSMKHGYTIVINEGNVVPAGVMMALQKILNQNVLTVKESGEEIIPHPAARIVITMNPPVREYRDSEPLNAATRDRFQTIYFDYLDEKDELNLLDQMANQDRKRISREDIGRLVEFANATRNNETWPTVSTRKLEHAIDWFDEGASVRGALKHVVKASAEPHQHPADTHEKIEDL